MRTEEWSVGDICSYIHNQYSDQYIIDKLIRINNTDAGTRAIITLCTSKRLNTPYPFSTQHNVRLSSLGIVEKDFEDGSQYPTRKELGI